MAIGFVTRSTSKKTPFVNLSIEGRAVKVYGITRNKMLGDLQSALEDLAEPIVRNDEIASAIDALIQKLFHKPVPRLPMRQVELGVSF